VLALGALKNDGGGTDAGRVRVYERSGDGWTPVGESIDGGPDDRDGQAVSLNADGTVVAISGQYTNGVWGGHVRIHQLVDGAWTPMGAALTGSYEFGCTLSLSGDGTILAVGDRYADLDPSVNTDSNEGAIHVYQWNNEAWVPLGERLFGHQTIPGADTDNLGFSVSLSLDGTIVAGSAIWNPDRGTGRSSGYMRVYHWQSGAWTPFGDDVLGEAANDGEPRTSVALSRDGKRAAYGAAGNDGTGADAGHVRVYDLTVDGGPATYHGCTTVGSKSGKP
jgi:hypothetical protein